MFHSHERSKGFPPKARSFSVRADPLTHVPRPAERRTPSELFLLSGALVSIVVCLVFLSLFSMELLSAARAYVNGEALWSKGQKDAALFLNRYAQSHSE